MCVCVCVFVRLFMLNLIQWECHLLVCVCVCGWRLCVSVIIYIFTKLCILECDIFVKVCAIYKKKKNKKKLNTFLFTSLIYLSFHLSLPI